MHEKKSSVLHFLFQVCIIIFLSPETSGPFIDRMEIFSLPSSVDCNNIIQNTVVVLYIPFSSRKTYMHECEYFNGILCFCVSLRLIVQHLSSDFSDGGYNNIRPHPTPYAETEARSDDDDDVDERKRCCWARTKQIDVANAGGIVVYISILPLFFANLSLPPPPTHLTAVPPQHHTNTIYSGYVFYSPSAFTTFSPCPVVPYRSISTTLSFAPVVPYIPSFFLLILLVRQVFLIYIISHRYTRARALTHICT